MEVEVEVENGYSGLVNSRFSQGIASTGRQGMGKVSCWMRWMRWFHRFDIAPFQYRNVKCIYKYAIITIIICLYDFICTLSLLQCATHKRLFKVIKPCIFLGLGCRARNVAQLENGASSRNLSDRNWGVKNRSRAKSKGGSLTLYGWLMLTLVGY